MERERPGEGRKVRKGIEKKNEGGNIYYELIIMSAPPFPSLSKLGNFSEPDFIICKWGIL